MFPGTEDHAELRALGDGQCGAVHRDQLRELGVSRSRITQQVVARRWNAVGRNVVLLQNTGPTRDQLMWLAVLDAGPGCALGSHTALELAGFRPVAQEAQQIHLIVRRGTRVTPLRGIRLHESRRLHDGDVLRQQGLPCTKTARSVLDAAAWQPYPRFACLMVAAAVQQRITTPPRLEAALSSIGRIRHKAYLRLAVADVAGGAHALGEIDLAALCRRFGLKQPDRQRRRRDPAGRIRYLDAEWELPEGEIVVLEVDGAHHRDAVHWEADMKRERQLVISRRWVLRATAFEIRLEPATVCADLVAMGVPRLPTLPTCQSLSTP